MPFGDASESFPLLLKSARDRHSGATFSIQCRSGSVGFERLRKRMTMK
jgi:hypothetical protein